MNEFFAINIKIFIALLILMILLFRRFLLMLNSSYKYNWFDIGLTVQN